MTDISIAPVSQPIAGRIRETTIRLGPKLISFLIIVLAPTLFWTSLCYALAEWVGSGLSSQDVILLAAMLMVFLTLIWCLLRGSVTAR